MKQNNYFQRMLSALVLLMASSLSWAYDFSAENADGVTIYYNLINDGTEAEVSSEFSGSYSGEVIIPSTVAYNDKTLSVTSIGNAAFYFCGRLTSVTIPNSVTSIGEAAFYFCYSLTSVTIGNGVTSIGEAAFYDCSSLTSITIPESVTSIGDSAFRGCSSLTSVTISEGVTSIGNRTFENCSSLTSITIPESVTSIGDDAFSGCSGLTSVSIPNSVTSIGNYAFKFCKDLTSVVLSDSLEQIPFETFRGCSSLPSIDIPDGVTSIKSGAFFDCSSLMSVTIPESVTSIGDAFRSCSSLTSITLPETIEVIENYTFAVSGLTSITIPNSVKRIGTSVFNGCKDLTTVTLGKNLAEIGAWTFVSCPNLAEIHSLSPLPPRTDFTFHSIPSVEDLSKIILYVPLGCKEAYVRYEWKEFTIVEEGVPDEAPLVIGDDHYATFMAPFEVEIPAGVTAYTVTGTDGDVLQLVEMEYSIPANTPVILYSEETVDETVSGTRMTTGTSYTDGLLTGVYTDMLAPAGSYVLQNRDGEVGFYLVEEDAQTSVMANRAYLTVPEATGIAVFRFADEDHATGVQAAPAGKEERKVIYDLTGRRVERATKGLYIKNGKKVVIR